MQDSTATDPGEGCLRDVLRGGEGKGDFKLSRDEAEKFKNAFADEGFRKLMADYVSEISDPKHRAEQESYIQQLESQNEVPSGKKIIRPNPGFVLKFKHTKLQYQQREKTKLFINMVYSDDIEPPKSEEVHNVDCKEKQSGRQWSVPYTIGPLRLEEDKGKSLVSTFDCCFHPNALINATKSPAFRDLIASTAREAAKAAFASMNDAVEIDEKFVIPRGVMYKNGKPPVMMVSAGTKASAVKTQQGKNNNPAEKRPSRGKEKPKSGDSAKESRHGEGGSSNGVGVEKGFLLRATKSRRLRHKGTPTAPPAHTTSPGMRGGGTTAKGKEIPHYQIVEKGTFDICDHTLDGLCVDTSRRPQFLSCRVLLPKVGNVSELHLDISDEKLTLRSLPEAPSCYHLDVKFDYPTSYEGGKAMFDREKKMLTVTIPTRPPEPLPKIQPSASRADVEDISTVQRQEESSKLGSEVGRTCNTTKKVDYLSRAEAEDVSAIQQQEETSKLGSAEGRMGITTKNDHHLRWVSRGDEAMSCGRADFARDDTLPTCNAVNKVLSTNSSVEAVKTSAPAKIQPHCGGLGPGVCFGNVDNEDEETEAEKPKGDKGKAKNKEESTAETTGDATNGQIKDSFHERRLLLEATSSGKETHPVQQRTEVTSGHINRMFFENKLAFSID